MGLLMRIGRWLVDRAFYSKPAAGTGQPPEIADEDVPEPFSPQRREFLAKLSVALGGLGAAIVGVPVVSVLLSPILRRPPDVWRDVGGVDDFAIGPTTVVSFLDALPLPWAGYVEESAAFLRRTGPDEFVAFSVYCTHTGCPVRWREAAGLFLCPCHGGAFHRDGRVAAGPPPEPLPRVPVRVRNGRVQVLASPPPVPPEVEETTG